MPIGASSNGTSFSSRACGAWSVAMQSIVPSRRPVDQRLPVVLGAQRRVHLQPRVEVLEQRLVGQREVVRRDLGGDPHAARLGRGDRLDRLARAQVLDVDPAVLVAGQRRVARDQRRLGDRRDAGQAEPRRHVALVHDAAAGERRVLLVQAQDAAREPLVLERLAQDAGPVDRLAVVGEPERAGVAQLGHLGQRLAAEAARDRRPGSRPARAPRAAPARAARAAPAPSRPPGRCSASPTTAT